MSIDQYIKKVAKKASKHTDELTEEQLEDAFLGAIKSGDFVKHVQGLYPNQKQGMSYIPYREKQYLQMKINKLKRLLFLTDKSVSFAEMNELTKLQINEFYKTFPEEKEN